MSYQESNKQEYASRPPVTGPPKRFKPKPKSGKDYDDKLSKQFEQPE